MTDVKQCAACGLRTLGEFCTTCVTKSAEVERVAVHVLGHLLVNSERWLATDKEGRTLDVVDDDVVRPMTRHALDVARIFVDERNKVRAAALRKTP